MASGQASAKFYLFDDYQDALVQYKEGGASKTFINYHMGLNIYLFKKNKSSSDLLILEPETVNRIIVGERVFVFNEDGMPAEVLATDPYLRVNYSVLIKENAPEGPFGSKTTTTQSSVTQILVKFKAAPGNTLKELEDESKYTVSEVKHNYFWERDEELHEFNTINKFLKLYPKEMQKTIRDFIKKNKTDISSPESILELVRFASELK